MAKQKKFFLGTRTILFFFIEHEQSVQDMFSSTRCSSTSHPNVRVPNDPGDDDYQCYGQGCSRRLYLGCLLVLFINLYVCHFMITWWECQVSFEFFLNARGQKCVFIVASQQGCVCVGGPVRDVRQRTQQKMELRIFASPSCL